MIDLSGRTFGKYRITGELGRGGMATVYKAVDTVLGRAVAIKVLPPQLGLDADPLKRFHREAQLASQLDHAGIVPIYDIGEQDGLHYIVMKFLEGKNLHDLMEQQGALPVRQAVSILAQIASAMDYAHGQGIIHRDIKPSNVIVGSDGRATLTDFGIARAVAGARITRFTTTIGTPGYMSPEQIDGAELDYRSDLFSLGVTAYEMLTGRVAYGGTTPEAVLKARFTTEPTPPSVARPSLGKGLDMVLRKAMAHAPADRYVSAAAFVADLERALGGEQVAAGIVPGAPGTVVTSRPPVGPKSGQGGKVPAIVPVGAAVALAMIALAWLMAPKSPPVLPTAVPPTRAVAGAPTTAPSAPTKAPAAPTEVVIGAVPTKAVSGLKVLRIGRGTYPDVLDPQKASFGTEIEVMKLAYEGLLSIDNKGNIGPGSAENWRSSPDGRSMTFNIRKGMKRFDGAPITAKDFEYALKREVDPCVSGKQYTSILYDVKGAEDLDNLDCRNDAAKLPAAWANYGVRAADDYTLVVTFKNPIGFWHYVAYTWVTYPSDKAQVDRDPENWWTRPTGHNGNGPFRIQTMEPGKKITFVPNPDYWRGKPKLYRIELIYNPDSTVMLEAYKKSEVDMDANVAPENIASIMADATLRSEFLRFPAAITTMIAFNNSRRPFNDINVRKAFSAAFDREGWIRDVSKGVGKSYTRWIPPGVPGSQESKAGTPAYDPRAAVQYLVNNGYAAANSTTAAPKVDCAKLGEIKLTYSSTPLNHSRFQFIAGNFTKVFGCPIMLDPVEASALSALMRDPKTMPQISRQGWIQDYPHPQNWLSVYWVCGAFSTRYGYCNKNFDALTAKADQELDFQRSLSLYQQAEDLLLADVPSAGAQYNENMSLVKPWVIGPRDFTGSSDAEWAGEWGPVWNYDIDLNKVPANYPKQ